MFYFKKIVCALSLCALSAMIVHAEEGEEREKPKNRIVVGIFGGGSSMSMSQEFYVIANNSGWHNELPGDHDKSFFGASYGGKVGYDMYFHPLHGARFYVDYMHSYFPTKEMSLGTFSMHTIGLNADYRFLITESFSAFAGAGLALNFIDMQYLSSSNPVGGSLNIGLAYSIGFVELEFRVRYLIYDLPEKTIRTDRLAGTNIAGQQPTHGIAEIDSPFSFHLGANFRF